MTLGSSPIAVAGVYGNALGGTGTTYGVYGSASGGIDNWAGYFDNGNVFVNNDLQIGNSGDNNTVTINGDLEVTGSISQTKTGYYSIGPADFVLTHERIKYFDYQDTICDFSESLIESRTIAPSQYYIDESTSLGVDIAGNSIREKMDLMAPIHIPHLATMNSVSLAVYFDSGFSASANVCFALIKTNINTRTKTLLGSNSIKELGLDTVVTGSIQDIEEQVDNSQFIYNLIVRYLNFDDYSMRVVGSTLKYME